MTLKLVVIGLDGADFRYMMPLIEQGQLPHLAQLMESGVSGKLHSTKVPVTSIAWSTMLTGCNPGKTGIMGGVSKTRSKTGQERNLSTHLLSFDRPPFWHYLNRAGLRTAVINVPMTYPLKPIDGYLISGFDTPASVDTYTFPPDLIQRMAQDGLAYDLIEAQARLSAIKFDATSIPEYVRRAKEVINKQAEIIEYAIHAWDVEALMTVCQITDFINHRTREIEAINAIYCQADDLVGRILHALPEETSIFVISDHGSQPTRRRVNLSRAMADAGLTTFQTGLPGHPIQRKSERILYRFLSKQNAKTIARWLKNGWEMLPGFLRQILAKPILKANPGLHMHADMIDWSQTKAYILSHLGPIYLNLRGREPQGIIEPGDQYEAVCREVIASLTAIVDPKTGHHPFHKVIRADTVWHGPHMDQAPDLIYLWSDAGYAVATTLREGTLFADALDTGIHAYEGIIIAGGSPLKPGHTLEGAKLIDVAPTLLASMGLPVPKEMDGDVLSNAFTPTFLAQHPITYQETETDYATAENDYTEKQIAEVEERLRGLGYID